MAEEAKQEQSANTKQTDHEHVPTIVIVIGMAGSGKTSLMQRINSHVHQHKIPSYMINLDPAVYEIPYDANIDIRDTINYKNVMKEYKLGPNGAILTSLNLFATKFHQVIDLIDKRKEQLDFVFIDTPGQIEVFTWSASGQIITETLACTYPTVLLYVMDTPRCCDPVTFMSNMTYACSIMHKTKLPFLLAFNKIDIQSHLFAVNWMQSLEDFEEALRSNQTYMSTLIKSLGNVLDAFYANISTVGVSSITGQGMAQCLKQIKHCKQQYFEQYKPMLVRKMKEKQKRDQKEQLEKDKLNGDSSDTKLVYKPQSEQQKFEDLMNSGL